MAGKEMLEQGMRRRKAILKFLRSYIAKNGFAPTIQEIAVAVDLVSPNATRNHLQKLADDGFIKMTPRIARAITLVEPAPDTDPVIEAARELYRNDQAVDPSIGRGQPWGRAGRETRERYRQRAELELQSA